MRILRGKVVEFLFLTAGLALIVVAQGWPLAQMIAVPLGAVLALLGAFSFLTGYFEWTLLDSYQGVRSAYAVWWKAQNEKSVRVRHLMVMDAYATLDNIVPFTVPEELVRRASPAELVFLDKYVADRVRGYLDRGNTMFWLKNGLNRRLGREYERRTEQREFR